MQGMKMTEMDKKYQADSDLSTAQRMMEMKNDGPRMQRMKRLMKQKMAEMKKMSKMMGDKDMGMGGGGHGGH